MDKNYLAWIKLHKFYIIYTELFVANELTTQYL